MKESSYTGHIWFVFKCVYVNNIPEADGLCSLANWILLELEISTRTEILRICSSRKKPWLLKHCHEHSKENTIQCIYCRVVLPVDDYRLNAHAWLQPQLARAQFQRLSCHIILCQCLDSHLTSVELESHPDTRPVCWPGS